MIEFEQAFSSAVLDRGFALYHHDAVLSMVWESADVLIAEVQGGSRYRVQIQWTEESLQATCSCPYGVQCKHAAAVCYALHDSPTWEARPRPADSPAEGTPDELEEALRGLTLAQWRTLGRQWLAQYPQLIRDLPATDNEGVWKKKRASWRRDLQAEIYACEEDWGWNYEALYETLPSEIHAIEYDWQKDKNSTWEALSRAIIYTEVVIEFAEQDREWQEYNLLGEVDEVFDLMMRMGNEGPLTPEQRVEGHTACRHAMDGLSAWKWAAL
ncbi:MAG TPA: hypothetical protein DCR93_29080, partial [Cytophagales bacterium]|nr:hypothetical protein [Cytophagales bacterium]